MPTIKTPQRTATVVLALDVSNSMAATDARALPHRSRKSRGRATLSASSLRGSVSASWASAQGGVITQPPTFDHADVLRAIDHLSLGGSTSLGAGILTALDAIAGKTLQRQPGAARQDDSGEINIGYYGGATIVLISDGEDTSGTDPVTMARLASTAGVRIQTVGVGTAAGTTVQIDGFTRRHRPGRSNARECGKGHERLVPPSRRRLARERRLPDDTTAFRDRERAHRDHSLFAAAAASCLSSAPLISLLWFGRVV